MRTKGLIFLVWLVGMIHAQAGDHVTELWRTSLGSEASPFIEGSGPEYRLQNATLDSQDKLILVGAIGQLSPRGFIAKYSSSGSQLWEFQDTAAHAEPQLLKTDAAGNIFITSGSVVDDPYTITLLKRSPEGTVLWSKEIACMSSSSLNPAHSLHVQADGTSYVRSSFVQETGPEEYDSLMAVTKFSPAGDTLWTTSLPGTKLLTGPDRPERLMHVDDAGNVLVAAISQDGGATNAFALKLDAAGNLLWRTTFPAGSVTSILPGPQSICVGLDGGWARLSPDGTLLNKNMNLVMLRVLDASANGQFLLESFYNKQHFLMDSDGTLAWTADTFANQLSYPIKDGAQGWLMVAHMDHNAGPAEYALISLRSDGNQRWRQELTPFPHQYRTSLSGTELGYWLFRASDQTLRLVCKQGSGYFSTYGIGMVAYRVEESNAGPKIISTPPLAVDWDGTTDLSLHYTVTGDGPLSYGSDFTIPQSESTITISKDTYPGTQWFYRWDITDANGRRAATRNTLVRFNQLFLYPQVSPGDGSLSLNVWADFNSRFRLEYSTNMVNWLPWSKPEHANGTQIDVPKNSATNYFFRAIKVE
jgi:predicted lipoprotein with Yx(FWY)xxD motif